MTLRNACIDFQKKGWVLYKKKNRLFARKEGVVLEIYWSDLTGEFTGIGAGGN